MVPGQCGIPVQVSTWPGQRPAGYHSGHVSACSSNEKCLTVNEINTDIRLAQWELRGKERVREKKRSGLAGEAEAARERAKKSEGEGGGLGENDDVKERWKNMKYLEQKAQLIS